MSTAEDLLARMQAEIEADPSVAPVDSDELSRLSLAAMVRDSGAPPAPQRPTLDVKMHGAGVPAHDVALDDAFAILNPLQNACSSIGQSIAQVATAAGKIPEAIKKATQLRLSSELSSGSVIFHLRAPAENVTGNEIPGSTGSTTLIEDTLEKLMSVVHLADTSDSSVSVVEEVRRFGPRTAKHLNDLADAVVSTEIDITLQWRSATSSRRVLLNRRAALGLQGAISQNRTLVNTVVIHGELVTASTVEPIAIRSEDRIIHLSTTPELAATLDALCFRQVIAQAEESITWRLSKGTESRKYTLLSIQLASE